MTWTRAFPEATAPSTPAGQIGSKCKTAAGKPQPEAIPLNIAMTEFSPFSCPIFLGHPEASGFCFQSERLLYRREPNGVRAEPGKQKTRSCRTQELARSSAQEKMSGGKRVAYWTQQESARRLACTLAHHRNRAEKGRKWVLS